MGPGTIDSAQMQTIYVYLRNEDIDVWRPVKAKHLRGEIFRIVSINGNPEDEDWQFVTNDLVRCEFKEFSDGQTGLVAVERVSDPSGRDMEA